MNKEKMKKELVKMLDQLEDDAGELKDSVQESLQEAREKAQEARDKANRYVRENPEKSVLAAVGLGLFVGIVLTMMKKHKCDR